MPDNSVFGCPTLEEAIELDKEYKPNLLGTGNYYIEAPNEYASKIRYGLPALNELYDNIKYPRIPTFEYYKNYPSTLNLHSMYEGEICGAVCRNRFKKQKI